MLLPLRPEEEELCPPGLPDSIRRGNDVMKRPQCADCVASVQKSSTGYADVVCTVVQYTLGVSRCDVARLDVRSEQR